jgi:hypothetical protein
MPISSTLKNASVGITSSVIFYAGVGIVFLAVLPFVNFPPHIALTGMISLVAAYGLLTKRAWAPWLVVALFLVALTITAFTLFFSMLVNWPLNIGLIFYLILSFYFMYYTLSRGTP